MSEITRPYVAKALLGPATMDWMDQRACNGVPAAVFFPEVGETAALARRICATCPVVAECLTYAMENRENYGVWGGLAPKERRSLQKHLKAPGRRSVVGCGSEAGYAAHRRRGEDACDACLAAHATYKREQKARQREESAA